jgi:chemotaxis protein MotB
MEAINTQHSSEVDQLQGALDTARQTITRRNLTIAERIGENNILLMLRDELNEEVETLKIKIETLSNNSSAAQQALSENLAAKEREIRRLRLLLQEVEQTMAAKEALIRTMAGDLDTIAQSFPDDIDIKLGFDYAVIQISESFLFRRNSATRLNDEGLTILEKIASIFQKFPSISVQVIGHTDTAPPRDQKRFGDNWNFSALQAATVVRTLIDEYDVSANQLTLSAKGEFAPRASNASPEGMLKNRRIELYIAMSTEELAKEIREVLALVNN